MVNLHIGDDVLYCILARLPGKSLLRFRCVSKHWNHLISDPYLMKLRSRRMIFLPFPRPLAVIDDNVPVEDTLHSMVRISTHSPLQQYQGLADHTPVSIVGTCNGIMLLCFYDTDLRCHLILYNPLTRESKQLLVMDPLFSNHINSRIPCVLGFGDLKIVRFRLFDFPCCIRYIWDVFDLKTSSWSTPQYLETGFHFTDYAGTFVNGCLYWLIDTSILAYSVKDRVLSKISFPYGDERTNLAGLILGSLDGCLCMVEVRYGFRVWLLKEPSYVKKDPSDCPWKMAHYFAFGPKGEVFHPICITGNGKILMTNSSLQLVIYDTSKRDGSSYKTLQGLATLDDLKRANMVLDFEYIHRHDHFKYIRSMEYVESLISPSNICSI
ncbi:hypothetical protein SSX86_018440 [Deinandra increscens subsp. villosa]|uniref:F-box domain-containing protein n=1 Tax=Deinandra increscens subsp. villosa TaxID=3103831 RepID=A0AAP0GUS3_9ASTR